MIGILQATVSLEKGLKQRREAIILLCDAGQCLTEASCALVAEPCRLR